MLFPHPQGLVHQREPWAPWSEEFGRRPILQLLPQEFVVLGQQLVDPSRSCSNPWEQNRCRSTGEIEVQVRPVFGGGSETKGGQSLRTESYFPSLILHLQFTALLSQRTSPSGLPRSRPKPRSTSTYWVPPANGGGFLGYLYLDVFPRDYKYAHKGHYKLQPGFAREDGSRHYPASAFVANYSPPTATRPSLLKCGEVVSCFHEPGHSLHNLTSETRHARFHGPAVPRDFVEIPSVILEHVFWNREILRVISGRYDTSEKQGGEENLPDELIDQLIASRFADMGLSDLSNLLLSSYDLKIHSPADHESELCLMSGPEDLGLGLEATHGYSRFRFPTGYDSVYYTYLLAQAFSYDIFETKFRPHLPTGNTKAAHAVADIVAPELREEFNRYRQIVLRPGASVTSYLGMLKDFLGRDPSPDAFIQMLRAGVKSSQQAVPCSLLFGV
ncbi:Thimet oligopeptidase [Tolypocladium paradoxum]|uniref:Thimet oligopeptidase n=1 Tax=Tolypocladium paradoxum TaxID=94208 RepID=A0A2S4KZH3_9HYPO|nr:Thimet oligopeptidase [Tolypocladium paradoxum]